jgi:hypothetical protein
MKMQMSQQQEAKHNFQFEYLIAITLWEMLG